MDIVSSLKEKLITDKKILSEFQTTHLNLVIQYLTALKKNFAVARAEYERALKDLSR